MGVFHDLFQPQRTDVLAARLAEYTLAGMDSGILFVSLRRSGGTEELLCTVIFLV